MSEQVVPETLEYGSQSPAVRPLEEQKLRYDQAAKAASVGLMSHPHIETAVVEISGPPHALVFHLQCSIYPDKDPSEVMETIGEGVIPNIERILDAQFVSRDLNFALTPQG